MCDIAHLEKLNKHYEQYQQNEKEIITTFDFNLKQKLFEKNKLLILEFDDAKEIYM